MIESVSTSFVQGASLRGFSQAGSAYPVASGGAAASSAELPRYGTRLYVRLDSGAERAILEVRSSETGEVVKQYPSEAQIRAFQRAATLESGREQQRAEQQVAEHRAQQSAREEAAPSRAAAMAAPQVSAAPAQSASDVYQAAAPQSSASVSPAPGATSGQPVSSGDDAGAQSILV